MNEKRREHKAYFKQMEPEHFEGKKDLRINHIKLSLNGA